MSRRLCRRLRSNNLPHNSEHRCPFRCIQPSGGVRKHVHWHDGGRQVDLETETAARPPFPLHQPTSESEFVPTIVRSSKSPSLLPVLTPEGETWNPHGKPSLEDGNAHFSFCG